MEKGAEWQTSETALSPMCFHGNVKPTSLSEPQHSKVGQRLCLVKQWEKKQMKNTAKAKLATS